MKTTIITTLTTALLFGAPGAAIAYPGGAADKPVASESGGEPRSASAGHGKAGFVSQYDLDGDGIVTKAEFEQQRKEGFDTRDADGNGTLTQKEYVGEYAARLDAELAETRQRQMR